MCAISIWNLLANSRVTLQLYDARTLKLLKTYKSDRPLNAAAVSPIYNHVVVGGGQEAKDVTTTANRVRFDSSCLFAL